MWHFPTMVKDLGQAMNNSMKGLNLTKTETLVYLDRLEDEKRS
jgi:hypothetical protein